ncbi:MAG: XrtN system VIT domain-containing protein [Bacteroidia bacterium]|nr:XrtN system VIT domain-containing protein [Bacteroidia bacterium]
MQKTNSLPDLQNIGYLCLLLCLSIFVYQLMSDSGNIFANGGGLFWIVYGLTVVYFLIVFIHHLQKRFDLRKNGIKESLRWDEKIYSILLVLFSLSAHSLNLGREIAVFAPYVNWLNGYMIVMHLAILVFPYRDQLPSSVQYLIYFVNGSGLLIASYMAIFLGPLNIYAIPLAIVLGVSLLALTPLFWVLHFLQSLFRMNPLPGAQRAFWLGAIVPIMILIGFLNKWNVTQNHIESARTLYQTQYADVLPEWVVLSQQLPDGPFTEMVLMSEAFSQKSFWTNETRGLFDQLTYRGNQRHNPLAVIAHIFHKKLDFSDETLIRLLESRYDARHQTHRRLWRGDDLETFKVQTDIQVYPQYRLAYLEKTLTIHNDSHESWSQQEAVYSFYLPEGSVVSSLSLWINGKEQPSRLTTRSKADSAYQQIVGQERRDPALVHWQEGNRISVTVFPCTPAEDRIFKIGFTAPLSIRGNTLDLKNVYFDGPSTAHTREEITLHIPEDYTSQPALFRGFKEKEKGVFVYKGQYQPDWELRFPAPALSENGFSFNGKSFRMQPLLIRQKTFTPQEIVLDINRYWTPNDLEMTRKLTERFAVYVFTPELTKLTKENFEVVTEELRKNQFTLLPLHKISNTENTLVISRSGNRSPLLNDLKDSPFSNDMSVWLTGFSGGVKWFHLGTEISPYVRTLKELRVLDFASGSPEKLEDWLGEGVFLSEEETSGQVNIHSAGVSISMDSVAQYSSAPDHLMRLYAYNDLLRSIGRLYFDKEHLEDQWIRQAEEAYIVSPVSSLTVLETQQDYERFDIKENKETLGNASINNDGSVPEPHEWLLIFLTAVVIAVLLLKKKSSVNF